MGLARASYWFLRGRCPIADSPTRLSRAGFTVANFSITAGAAGRDRMPLLAEGLPPPGESFQRVNGAHTAVPTSCPTVGTSNLPRPAPAMTADVTGHLWKIGDIVRRAGGVGGDCLTMDIALLKALVVLVPVCMLFSGSAVMFFRGKTAPLFLQLFGAGCLVVVVFTHVFEALHFIRAIFGRPAISSMRSP
jgi:hypothetical protein